LTINAGSSSIKFSLFDTKTLQEDYHGTISGIGFDTSTFTVVGANDHFVLSREIEANDHTHAVSLMRDWIADHIAADQVIAIGYRIVHGGPSFSQPCLINDIVLKELHAITPLDPEHLPTQMAIIEQLRGAFTETPHVACFDTAFFHNLPVESRRLPLPRKYESQGMRRYGFHGLSYSYLLKEFEQVAGYNAARGKVIFAHLGNGASLAALKNSQPIDTTMGLTPVGGLPMSTRTGDLDPGILTYLAGREQLNAEQLRHIVGFESGLLGISDRKSVV
jgi:acetate kinase